MLGSWNDGIIDPKKGRCCDVNRHFFDNQKFRALASIGIMGLPHGCIIKSRILMAK